jgi:hypothetical protein
MMAGEQRCVAAGASNLPQPARIKITLIATRPSSGSVFGSLRRYLPDTAKPTSVRRAAPFSFTVIGSPASTARSFYQHWNCLATTRVCPYGKVSLCGFATRELARVVKPLRPFFPWRRNLRRWCSRVRHGAASLRDGGLHLEQVPLRLSRIRMGKIAGALDGGEVV